MTQTYENTHNISWNDYKLQQQTYVETTYIL